MAPALPLAPRDEPEALHSHRRRALVSVDNRAGPMDEDDMGLPNQPSLAKDSQEMEQILVDLGGGEIGHPDLLQALKTLETAGDSLSTGDPDAIFQFSGLDLAENVDSEGDQLEEKAKLSQIRLERRCAFLQRRLRILQLRSIGKRVSEEVVQTFEKSTRGARKDGGGRPMGLKAFLKRVETTAALQASAASQSVVGPKHYNASTSRDASRSASMGISSGVLTGLPDTAGALRKHLTVVKRQLDSDATLSSSGAESNDETVTYNNPHQQHMRTNKRALWTWQRRRAFIAARWCWLQAQIQELEYKIRQHTDLLRQVREAKGAVEFEGEPRGYVGSLPGAEIPDNDPATETCARARPLRRETFKKRKLLQMDNLHIATQKAAKPSDINCRCSSCAESCAVCTGRGEAAQTGASAAPASTPLARARRDPAYHPVLSTLQDVSPSVHLSLAPKWWLQRPHKSQRGAHHSQYAQHATHAQHTQHTPAARAQPHTQHNHTTTPRTKRHPTKLKRGRPPLSRKIRDRERDDETTSGHDRSRGRSSTETRYRRQSYDIDNIVIPQSVAANTRPQILTYKEIITPKWRVLELPETPLNNGVSKSSTRLSVESEEEDVSDQAVQARHTRAERSERTRFAQNHRELLREQQREQRREMQRELELQQTHERELQQLQERELQQVRDSLMDTDEGTETVRPYTPRQFPLPDDMYESMVAAMPDGYRHSPPPSPPPEEEVDRSSSLSPLSPTVFDGDDPDDQEWDPSSEKAERRKSAFR